MELSISRWVCRNPAPPILCRWKVSAVIPGALATRNQNRSHDGGEQVSRQEYWPQNSDLRCFCHITGHRDDDLPLVLFPQDKAVAVPGPMGVVGD